jgi:hypothetical protein
MTHAAPIALCLLTLSATPAAAQSPSTPDATPTTGAAAASDSHPFRLGGEIKFNVRHSRAEESRLEFDFPPNFLPPGETAVFMRTPSPGGSVELSNLALIGEGDLTPGVAAKVEVHFLDLYNRNPTSSDDRILLREAWVRIGPRPALFDQIAGTTGYVLAGQAPRFSKPLSRRLESYGLWTTAVGRFENPQVQGGGTIGTHVYWRASLGNGNPVFMRDVNALAGDNGTPERVPDPTARAPYESGFPILYDAKPQDLNPTGNLEYGFGGGYAKATETWAVDVLGWVFGRELAPTARIRGTYYSGDIKLLTGPGVALPISGNDKRERGVNVDARIDRLRLFGQYVDQEIAGLPRRGFELEAAYRIPLDGLFLVGETPVGNWLQPVIRVSHIDNRFDAPVGYPAPSVDWDWTKIDLGARLGLTTNTDFTFEYNVNRTQSRLGEPVRPNELLATVRVGF